MLKRILLFNLMVFMLFLNFHPHAFAEAGQKFTVDGYYIDASVDKIGGKINIRGEISGGKRAKNLKIKFKLEDNDGNKKTATLVISDYTGHERFSKNEHKCGAMGTRWLVSEVIVY